MNSCKGHEMVRGRKGQSRQPFKMCENNYDHVIQFGISKLLLSICTNITSPFKASSVVLLSKNNVNLIINHLVVSVETGIINIVFVCKTQYNKIMMNLIILQIHLLHSATVKFEDNQSILDLQSYFFMIIVCLFFFSQYDKGRRQLIFVTNVGAPVKSYTNV